MLERMRNALRRWAERLFRRRDKKRPDQPQQTTIPSTGTNATEQHDTAPTWPLQTDSHQPVSTRDAQTAAHGSQSKAQGTQDGHLKPALKKTTARGAQVTNTSAASNNQPQSGRRKPQSTQGGYLKPALKKKAANETPAQGPSRTHPGEYHNRKLPIGNSSSGDEEATAQSEDRHADDPSTTGALDDTNNNEPGHHERREHFIDHTIHPRPAVVHEEIKPHVHAIYEPQRTLSFHLHEHRTWIQPIVDPAAK